MDDLYNDEHDEDDLPMVSATRFAPPLNKRVSTEPRRDADNDLLDRFARPVSPSKAMQSWENLYQTSLRSIQDDDDDDHQDILPRREEMSFTPARSFPSEERRPVNYPSASDLHLSPEESSYSAIYEQPIDSSQNKSKWQIRLPQLLHGTIGPDRQKRDVIRRHTTDIVFQQSSRRNQDFSLPSSSSGSNGMETRAPINPLVKQLRQKFDRMAASSPTSSDARLPQQTFPRPPKLRRVTSLTGRGLTSDTDQWLSARASPMLPNRPAPNIGSSAPPVRSSSTSSLNSQPTTRSDRSQRSKQGPPVSYPKHFYPPPSTASIVKQLLDSGATLVYDSSRDRESLTSNGSTSANATPLSIAQRGEQLKTITPSLNGRALPDDSSESGYSTINPRRRPEAKSNRNVLGKEPQRDLVEDENDGDEEEGDYYATYQEED